MGDQSVLSCEGSPRGAWQALQGMQNGGARETDPNCPSARSGLGHTALAPGVRWWAIDMPPVVAAKRAQLGQLGAAVDAHPLRSQILWLLSEPRDPVNCDGSSLAAAPAAAGAASCAADAAAMILQTSVRHFDAPFLLLSSPIVSPPH